MKQILVNYTATDAVEEVRENNEVVAPAQPEAHSLSINCGNVRTHKSEYNEKMKDFVTELETLINKYYGD